MFGFKNFHCAQRKLKGIELMKMIKKGQFKISKKDKRTDTEIFYSLASQQSIGVDTLVILVKSLRQSL